MVESCMEIAPCVLPYVVLDEVSVFPGDTLIVDLRLVLCDDVSNALSSVS